VDRYTKTVLTVIAAALIGIALKPTAQPAYAEAPATVRCELPEIVDVNIEEVGGHKTHGEVDVRVIGRVRVRE